MNTNKHNSQGARSTSSRRGSALLGLTAALVTAFAVAAAAVGVTPATTGQTGVAASPGGEGPFASVPESLQVLPVAYGQSLDPASSVRLVPANWFTDWQTCSWGIGVPTALGKRNPKKAWVAVRAALSKKTGRAFIAMYGQNVYNACKRFIQS